MPKFWFAWVRAPHGASSVVSILYGPLDGSTLTEMPFSWLELPWLAGRAASPLPEVRARFESAGFRVKSAGLIDAGGVAVTADLGGEASALAERVELGVRDRGREVEPDVLARECGLTAREERGGGGGTDAERTHGSTPRASRHGNVLLTGQRVDLLPAERIHSGRSGSTPYAGGGRTWPDVEPPARRPAKDPAHGHVFASSSPEAGDAGGVPAEPLEVPREPATGGAATERNRPGRSP